MMTQDNALRKRTKLTPSLVRARLRFHLLAIVLLTFSISRAQASPIDVESLRLAIEDLSASFPDTYTNGSAFLDRLARIDLSSREGKKQYRALQREALLANPLLDFESLLLIKRSEKQLGLVQNWESNSSLPMAGFDNEIVMLVLSRPDSGLQTVFRPHNGVFAGDVDLHFDAGRFLFSMPGANGRWQIHEFSIADNSLRELPLIPDADVDNYDACYLPNDDVIFTSTAPFVGVPCVTGSSHVSNLYVWKHATDAIRRLTFEQDHDWCPTLMNDGRLLYLRWEYSDIPHFVSRILFTMKPDGTEQMAFYGSNSYWPNAMFYARPIPASPSRFVAIVGGHHDVPRMGELVVFDAAKGRFEADGVVQRIPGRGKRVEPIIRDGLVQDSWPKFLHPFPLGDKYFLVSAKPTPESLWGVYLVDTFDNMLLIKELPGYALLEPLPLRRTQRPPAIPSSIQNDSSTATVYMQDVYVGPGLAGVPRGTVKALRVFTYHFAYHGVGGQINRVGLDGPWDIKRVLGTVPVEPDGSALFTIPANTPVSLQPLDAQGQALQLMRSWMTAMPGETLSCVGCHEARNQTPPPRPSLAARRAPSEIAPWYGPTRGFSFDREVQPVLDRYCTGCHDGVKGGIPDFRRAPAVNPPAPADAYRSGTRFTPAYLALRRYVRTPTMEGDMHLLTPLDFHASTTELVQLLRAGHHDVSLDAEAWDRLVTWIDLNTPAHGTWHEITDNELLPQQRDRRRELMSRYAAAPDEDPELIPATYTALEPLAAPPLRPGLPTPPLLRPEVSNAAGAPPPSPDAHSKTIRLTDNISLVLRQIPAGEPTISEPFWMAVTETSNALYALFDPDHDSRIEHGDFLHFCEEERGWPLNLPEQPVVRVSFDKALAFCGWLSKQTGEHFTLPTEEQWEHACRAGTASPLWYGSVESDFAACANLADSSLYNVEKYPAWGLPFDAIHPWRPAIDSVNDGFRVSAPVGSYQPNPWGLHDMHGNVSEWTASDDGSGNKVIRGGSWYDRPYRAASTFRRTYPAWQCAFDVGFRVVCSNRVEVASAALSAEHGAEPRDDQVGREDPEAQ